MMALSMQEKSLDKAEAFTTTKMDQFMMENGLRTKDQGSEKCYSETDQSMMDTGTLIKSMEKESTFPQMEIGTKDHSTIV